METSRKQTKSDLKHDRNDMKNKSTYTWGSTEKKKITELMKKGGEKP